MIVPKKLFFLSLGVLLVIFIAVFLKSNLTTAQDTLSPEFRALSAQEFLGLSSGEQNKYIEQLSAQKSPEEAWEFIKQTFASNESPQSAHDLAHLTGGLIYQQNQFKGLSSCSGEFAFGCFHGFLDQAFLNGVENLSLAEESCNRIGQAGSGPVASCIHGIGHGLASFYQVRNLEGSLKECERLKSGQQFCYDGVFMEYQRSASPKFYDITNPLYPCDSLADIYASSCGRNQPQVMMQRFKFDFNQIVNTCNQTDNLKLQEACFDSLGFYTISFSQANSNQIILLCNQPQISNFTQRCLKAAAGELVFQNIPNWKQLSQRLCFSQKEAVVQNECLNYTQQLAQEYKRY